MIPKAVRNFVRKATYEELKELQRVCKAFESAAKAREEISLQFPDFLED
jgi:hypothetical protein